MDFPKCSIVVSTYNWPRALSLCLQSIAAQTYLPDEVVIADDGSDSETRALVSAVGKNFTVPVTHIWHEDKGFRLAQIRNKAIAAAKHPYIIQIDGDLILEKHFIEDHLSFARKNYFVRGSRSMMDDEITQEIFRQNELPSLTFLRKYCTNKLNSKRNLWIARYLRYRYKTKGKNCYKVIGCNMAFWKNDFMRVNGYNEKIIGWGPEDIELSIRLIKSGIKKQSLKMAGVAFHLFHKGNSRSNREIHQHIVENTLRNIHYTTEHGVRQHVLKMEL